MFLRILSNKLGIKENKWHQATLYALGYMVMFLVLISLIEFYLNKLDLLRNIIMSFFVGILMFGAYLLKYELFYSKVKL